MQEAGVLIMQLLVIGAFGYIFSTITMVMGKREFGNLIKIVSVVMIAVVALQLVAVMVGAVVNFLEPVMKFMDRWS